MEFSKEITDKTHFLNLLSWENDQATCFTFVVRLVKYYSLLTHRSEHLFLAKQAKQLVLGLKKQTRRKPLTCS